MQISHNSDNNILKNTPFKKQHVTNVTNVTTITNTTRAMSNNRRRVEPAAKKRIVTKTRFDEDDEENEQQQQQQTKSMKRTYVPANDDDDSDVDDDDMNDDQPEDDNDEYTSDEDISDDEQHDSDVEEDEDKLLQQIEQMKISQTTSGAVVDENDKESYYKNMIRQAQLTLGASQALDYDYQEADDEEVYGDESGVKKTKNNVAIYNPKTYHLADDEELDYSNEAYTMFHRMNVEWPCLSCDLINDNNGLYRADFPMTTYMVAGSQASEKAKNRIYVLKMSNLLKTEHDSDSESEDEDEDVVDSKEEDNEEEENDEMNGNNSKKKAKKASSGNNLLKTKEPILEHLYIPLNTEVNRIKCMPQNTRMCALMCSDASLRIFDTSSQFELLSRDANNAKAGKIPITGQKHAIQVLKDHRAEGFALDWSTVVQGHLASGDFNANICVHTMLPDGTWKLRNNYNRHSKSVEDVQWSPSEDNVFASCSCDGKVMIWDVRQPKKEGLSFQVSNTDVNVIAWNKLKQNQIASGDDDGIVTVWDMRAIATKAPQTTVAQFNYLQGEHVTSMEWHPTDDSILAVSSDFRVTIWDLSLETDVEAKDMTDAGEDDEEELDIPAQLRFEHFGQNIKEVHWSVCLKDVLVCTGEMGIQVWKPSIEL